MTRNRNGDFERNLGWKITKNGKRSQPKFYLGDNEKDALKRLGRIAELWEHIEATRKDPRWYDNELDWAKLLARGELQIPIDSWGESPHSYVVGLNMMSARYPMINFVGADEAKLKKGKNDNREIVEHELKQLVVRGVLTEAEIPVKSDGCLHKALSEYQHWIEKEYFDVFEQHVSDTGMTLISQVKTIMNHVADRPIGELNHTGVDEIIGVFRKRPISRYGTPMKLSSSQNYVTVLGQFFDWLDLSEHYRWRLPERYHRIKRKVDEFDEDVIDEAAEVEIWTIDQLCILNKYATARERVFLLLGINCAFGVDQIGRLRKQELRLSDDGDSFVERIRRKKKVEGRHLLWKQTIGGIRWALGQHEELKIQTGAEDFVLLSSKGTPYWRKTIGGNRARDIPNRWYDLLDRINVDYPDFPRLGFNSLRDTSIHMIRVVADAETASVHATHKHQSSDKNLRRYSNPVWEKLFRAQQKLEVQLDVFFAAAPEDPFGNQPQAYISKLKLKRIFELANTGMSNSAIAAEVGVSHSTVWRKLRSRKVELAE
ncbi:helix-turn-helix domain-containing protein [Rubripirellula sp.]|nr:helix-turn-helix domain-containing protein [Rubripirellula sp.]